MSDKAILYLDQAIEKILEAQHLTKHEELPHLSLDEKNMMVIGNTFYSLDEIEGITGFTVQSRNDMIELLQIWIAERKMQGNLSDIPEMENDLEFLQSIDDEYILSSLNTNDYVAVSIDPERVKKILSVLGNKIDIPSELDNSEAVDTDTPLSSAKL